MEKYRRENQKTQDETFRDVGDLDYLDCVIALNRCTLCQKIWNFTL